MLYSRFFALVVVGSVAGGAVAQSPPSGRFFSPTNPALVDIDGNGPSSGDAVANPLLAGGALVISHPWESCFGHDPLSASFFLDTEGGPEYTVGTRTFEGATSTVSIDDFDSNNRPSLFMLDHTTGAGSREGVVELLDENDNGFAEGFEVRQTSGVSTFPTMAFDFVAANVDTDPRPDYVSIPWSASSAAQMGIRSCSHTGVGPETQIWIPLAYDGDGDPAVILDADNDGQADPFFFFGPKLEFLGGGPVNPLEIPTAGGWGLLVLALALLGIGCWRVRATASAT